MSEIVIGILYVAGFAVSAGVLSALWGHDYQPGPVFAAVIWPVFLPLYLTYLGTRQHMRHAEARRIEWERQQREQAKVLREAGLE